MKVLGPRTLLIWNQRRKRVAISDAVPVELFIIDLDALQPISPPFDPIYQRRNAGEAFFVVGGTPVAAPQLETSDVESARYAEFPEVLQSMDELLILCHSPMTRTSEKSADLALIISEPRASLLPRVPSELVQ